MKARALRRRAAKADGAFKVKRELQKRARAKALSTLSQIQSKPTSKASARYRDRPNAKEIVKIAK